MKVQKEENKFHEFNAHFKYTDLFNELLKIKTEREKKINIIKDKNKPNSNKNANNKLLNTNSIKKIQSRNIEMNNYLNNLKLIENKNETTEIKVNSKVNKTYVNIIKDNKSKASDQNQKLEIFQKINKKEEVGNRYISNNNKKVFITNKNKNKDKNKASNNNNILNNSIKKIIKDSKCKKSVNIINIKSIKKNNYKNNKKLQQPKFITKFRNNDIGILSSNSNNKSYNKMIVNNHINQQIKDIYKYNNYRSISRRTKSKTKSKSNKKVNKNISFKKIKSIKYYNNNSMKGILINKKISNSNVNIKKKININLNKKKSPQTKKKSYSTSITKKTNKYKINYNLDFRKGHKIIKSNPNKHIKLNEIYNKSKNKKSNNSKNNNNNNSKINNKANFINNIINKKNINTKLQTRKSTNFNSSNNSLITKYNNDNENIKNTKNNSSNKTKNRKTHSNIQSNSKNKAGNSNCNIIKKEKSQRIKRMKTFKENSPYKKKVLNNNRNKFIDNKLFELIKKNPYSYKSNNNISDNIFCIKNNKNKIISRNDKQIKRNLKEYNNNLGSKKYYNSNINMTTLNSNNKHLNKKINFNFTVNLLKVSRNNIKNNNNVANKEQFKYRKK